MCIPDTTEPHYGTHINTIQSVTTNSTHDVSLIFSCATLFLNDVPNVVAHYIVILERQYKHKTKQNNPTIHGLLTKNALAVRRYLQFWMFLELTVPRESHIDLSRPPFDLHENNEN